MKIRKADASDIVSIVEVVRQSYATVADRFGLTPENCPKHPSNCTAEWVENDFQRGVTYFVIERNDRMVGCIALELANKKMCYLERLAVLPESRRQGFGLALFQHFLTEVRLLGLRSIGIGLIANQDDLKAWYRKLGFRETGMKTFPHLPFDVAFMEYAIQQ